MNNNTKLKDSTYKTLIKMPLDNLTIKTLKQAIIELSESGGGGTAPDLSEYAKKSGLYHDASTPVDLETETQALNTATDSLNTTTNSLSTRIDTLEAVDMSVYASKSGLYKDASTAVNLETQCQDIEARVAVLETPAMEEAPVSRATEEDKLEIAQMVFQKLIKDQDFLNGIIKEVIDRITPYRR
jgi:hypothetical protein